MFVDPADGKTYDAQALKAAKRAIASLFPGSTAPHPLIEEIDVKLRRYTELTSRTVPLHVLVGRTQKLLQQCHQKLVRSQEQRTALLAQRAEVLVRISAFDGEIEKAR